MTAGFFGAGAFACVGSGFLERPDARALLDFGWGLAGRAPLAALSVVFAFGVFAFAAFGFAGAEDFPDLAGLTRKRFN